MLETDPGRMIRINKLLRHTLSDLLRKFWRQEAVAITLTSVETTPDLYDAHVYYSVLTDDKASAVAFFRKHVGMISKAMAREVTLKRTPRLHFVYDPTLKNAAAVDRVMMELEKPAPAAKPAARKPARKPAKKKPARE